MKEVTVVFTKYDLFEFPALVNFALGILKIFVHLFIYLFIY